MTLLKVLIWITALCLALYVGCSSCSWVYQGEVNHCRDKANLLGRKTWKFDAAGGCLVLNDEGRWIYVN
jgi:hypothetical protein